MSNPIDNKVRAWSVERYIKYLNLKLKSEKTSAIDRKLTKREIDELQGQLDDYNNNIKIRLVVNNTVKS